MATIEVQVCDNCGRQKQEVNHWMIVGGGVENPQLYKSESDWEEDWPNARDIHLDFCSQKCLTTILQRWMDTGSIEKVQIEHPAEGSGGGNEDAGVDGY